MSDIRSDAEAHGVVQGPVMGHDWLLVDRESGRIHGHFKRRSHAEPWEGDPRFLITPAVQWFAEYKGG